MSETDALLNRLTLSVPEAGKLLDLAINAAYAAARRKDFQVVRLGRRMVVPVAPLKKLLGLDDAGKAVA